MSIVKRPVVNDWPFSYIGLLFPAYTFEFAAVGFPVHYAASIGIALVPDSVVGILKLRPIPDCAVPMSVARRWISSHFIYLLSEWRLCMMKLIKPVVDPYRSARRSFRRFPSCRFVFRLETGEVCQLQLQEMPNLFGSSRPL